MNTYKIVHALLAVVCLSAAAAAIMAIEPASIPSVSSAIGVEVETAPVRASALPQDSGAYIEEAIISVAAGDCSSANHALSGAAGDPAVGEVASENYSMVAGVEIEVSCCLVPGDASDDGAVDIGDAVYLINYIFKGGPEPPCLDEGDANADAAIDIGDAVHLINYIFKSGPAPVCP